MPGVFACGSPLVLLTLRFLCSVRGSSSGCFNAKRQVHKSLIQVTKLSLVPIESKKALAAFLQQPGVEELPDDHLSVSNPEAHAYEFQSGGVVEMLEKLKDQFGTKKYELEREEMNAKHAFEQMFQQLADNIENAEHEVSKKEELRAEAKQYKARREEQAAMLG